MTFGMENYHKNMIESYGQDVPTPEMKLRQLEADIARLRQDYEELLKMGLIPQKFTQATQKGSE